MNSCLIVELLSNLSSLPCRKLHVVLAALTVPEDVGNKICGSIWCTKNALSMARGVIVSIPNPPPRVSFNYFMRTWTKTHDNVGMINEGYKRVLQEYCFGATTYVVVHIRY